MYIIMQASHAHRSPRASEAYRGPTTKVAGVKPGVVYSSLKDAEKDSARLREWNPAGFVVVSISK